MFMYFCPYCGRETEHVNVSEAAASAHVTRRTIYNWLDRTLVHSVHRPSGRRFICVRSLVVSDGFDGSQRSRSESPRLRLPLRVRAEHP